MRIEENLFVLLLENIVTNGLCGSEQIETVAVFGDKKAELKNNLLHVSEGGKRGIAFHIKMLDKDQQEDIALAIQECLEEVSYELGVRTLATEEVASRSIAVNH